MSLSQQVERSAGRVLDDLSTRKSIRFVGIETAKDIQTESSVRDTGEAGFFPRWSWGTFDSSATAAGILSRKGTSTQLVPIDDSAYWERVDACIRTTTEPSRWFRYVWRRLDQLESGENRDDPEESYPTPQTVSYAREVAQILFKPRTPTPSVVPGDNGGVAFVWHKGGLDIELSVDEDEVCVWIYARESERYWAGSLAKGLPLFNDVLNYLERV